MMYYSPSTPGFYDEISSRPSDCIELTMESYREFISGIESGKLIAIGPDGYPFLTEQIAEPADIIAQADAKKVTLRAMADSEIAWLEDAADAGMATQDETVKLTAWKKYRILLMRVDTAKPEWPPLPEL